MSEVQWVVNGYFVAMLSLMLTAGSTIPSSPVAIGLPRRYAPGLYVLAAVVAVFTIPSSPARAEAEALANEAAID